MRNNLWDGWNITEKIGEGRSGEVYKATKRVDGVTLSCAIKYVSLPKNQEELNALVKSGVVKDVQGANKYYLKIIEDLKKEIAIMQMFNGNPYVIDCFDFIQESKYDNTGIDFYIRMELAEDINSYFSARKASEADVVQLGIDICNALELCASLKIIHKDIKPSNIYIGSDGKYKLSDFGIASTLDESNKHVLGTYSYMSPEVYNKKEISFSTDLYSLGLVMYRLLNGNKLPFESKMSNEKVSSKSRLAGKPIPPIKGVDDRLMNIILKACNYDSSLRYKSATDMKKDLEKLTGKVKVDKGIAPVEKTLSIYDTEIVDNGKYFTNSNVSNKPKATKPTFKMPDFKIKPISKETFFKNKDGKFSRKILWLVALIVLILLLIYGCSYNKKCDAGYVNKNGSCVKGYYYCDNGYSLNKDNKCQKTTESIDARVNAYCDDDYILNGDYCVKSDTKEPKMAYQCATGFTLNGTKCVAEEAAAPNASYSCPSGYTLIGDKCGKAITEKATTSYTCPSGYTLSGTTCSKTENNSSYVVTTKTCSRGTYNSSRDKCCVGFYCIYEPTVNKSCSQGTYSNGTCVVKSTTNATTKYSCSSGYQLVANQCVKTETKDPSVSLSCSSGYTLKSNVCYRAVSVDAVPGYSCDSGYVFNGQLCIANEKKDPTKEYSCSKKYTLNGDKCEKYEIVNSKVHYDK
ncbi:MAG: serine/threonine protein kinase [Bacilli bacterium]|nr:serine/threonine protein kinase [Bacilli bacterium]